MSITLDGLGTRPDGSKFTNEYSRFINQAIKICMAHSDLTKVSVFCNFCNLTENQLVNIMNHRTVPSYGQLLDILSAIRQASKPAYKWLIEQMLGEWEDEE